MVDDLVPEIDIVPLDGLSPSVNLKRKKKRRQESVEWNTVRILKDHPNNPSWECLHCDKKGYGGVTLVRKHLLEKCCPFDHMQSRYLEAKNVVEQALILCSVEKKRNLDNFNAAQFAKVGTTLKDKCTDKEAKNMADCAVANWIFEDCRPLISATTPAFKELLQMVSHYSIITKTNYKPPSRDTITGTLMKKSIIDMEIELERLQIVAEKYGTTVVSDGWKNCRRQPIVNLLMISSDEVVFIDCIDTTGHKKDANFIVDFVQRGLEERVPKCLKGTECLVVMDGACSKALALLEQRSTHLITSKCACHGLDLMLEKLCGQSGEKTKRNQEWAFTVIRRLEFIVNFVLNHEFSLGLYRKYAQSVNGVNKNLVKPGETRFASKFLLISRAVDVLSNLERVMVDPEWTSRLKDQARNVQEAGAKVKREVQMTSLWDHARDLWRLFTPLYKILRLSDQGGPTMAVLDGEMREARELMSNFETNNYVTDLRLRNCVKLFDARWEWFRSPVHRVGYLVNPYYAYKSNYANDSEQDLEAIITILSKLLPNVNDQAKALSQYNFFRELGGAFGSPLAKAAVHKMAPHEWFGTFGVATRPFSFIAMKVLNMRVGQSEAERSFKRQSDIHSKKRNRLTHENVKNLVWLSSNMALKRRWFNEAIQGAHVDQQQDSSLSLEPWGETQIERSFGESEDGDISSSNSYNDQSETDSIDCIELESDSNLEL